MRCNSIILSYQRTTTASCHLLVTLPTLTSYFMLLPGVKMCHTYRFFGCEAAMEVNLRPTNITHEPALPGFPVLISRFSASSSYKGWSRVYPAGRSAQGFHCPRRFRPRLFLSPLDRWILSLEKRERPQNQEIASLYRRGLVSSLGDGTKRRY